MRYLIAWMALALSLSNCGSLEAVDEVGGKSFVIPSSLDGYVLVLDETKAERRQVDHFVMKGSHDKTPPPPVESTRWESTAPKHKGFSRELFRDPDHANMWREALIPYGIQWLVLNPPEWQVLNPLNGKTVVVESSYRKTGDRTADFKFITDIEEGCDTLNDWTFHLSFDAPLSGTVQYRYWCWEYAYEYRNVTFKLVLCRDLIGTLPYGKKEELKGLED